MKVTTEIHFIIVDNNNNKENKEQSIICNLGLRLHCINIILTYRCIDDGRYLTADDMALTMIVESVSKRKPNAIRKTPTTEFSSMRRSLATFARVTFILCPMNLDDLESKATH
ncbi:Hypothetical predicted protein [Octopus vulgaris]|uniref:Uncharacterized protein n=1 Tax=Octopus vulgaris TaxID=6645 RepID=A0AA36ANY1_OCTVU|nr:Hypothetical predicted protein [Octopus vulgaris]